MTDHVITVVNASSGNAKFMLFVDNTKTTNTYTNVFYLTPLIGQKTGRSDLTIDPRVYAVCGMATAPLGEGVSVRNYQSLPLQLNPSRPDAATAAADDTGFVFTNDITTMGSLSEGQMGIEVNPYPVDQYPYAFVGYGQLVPNDATGPVSPVITTRASPGGNVVMQPRPIFFLVVGNTPRGIIASKESFQQYASIDFTLQPPGKNFAIVTYTDTGTFTIEYDYNLKA